MNKKYLVNKYQKRIKYKRSAKVVCVVFFS